MRHGLSRRGRYCNRGDANHDQLPAFEVKILHGLQCEKRLWMQIHQPEEGEFSEATERLFSAGHRVGEVARSLFPGGVLIETGGDLRAAIEKTREVLAG